MNAISLKKMSYVAAADLLVEVAGLPPSTPTDGANLSFERGGWTCVLYPHPFDAQALVIEIELGSADEAADEVDPLLFAGALRALLQVGDLLADQTPWRLGISEGGMVTIAAVVDFGDFDAREALGMMDDGLQRGVGLLAIWHGALRGGAGIQPGALPAAGRPPGAVVA